MKRLYYLWYLAVLICCCSNSIAQTNKGTEFWTAYMAHINGAGSSTGSGSQMSLYITTDITTDFKVEFADGTLIASGTVNANTVYTPPVTVPPSAYLGNSEADPAKKGIHITSTKPITVYAHIYDKNVSGATLLLPVNSLNKDYYSINFDQLSNATNSNPAFSTFAVIGTEDGTTVRITPSKNIIKRTGTQNSVTHPANVAYTISLNKGDVYQGASDEDLTGTRILSVATGTSDCKKIAVFSGSSKIRIGSPFISSDNLFQQAYPTSVWGKKFVTAPLAGRSYDVFRVIYSDITASVKVNGTVITPGQIQTAGSIGYYQFATPNGNNAANVIESDKPIQVAQYAVTQGNVYSGGPSSESVGDPEMIFLSPIEQGLNKVTLYSSAFYEITDNFINVVIPTSAIGTFMFDGTLYGAANFKAIANTTYSYTQIRVQAGSHTITAAERFNAVAYGFGSLESYGYAAGTNLLNLNENISLSGLASTSTQLNGCTGVPYFLQLTVPYQPTQIIWDPADGAAPTTQANPAYYKSETLADGTTLYTYRFYRTVSYATGNYLAKATVTLPVVTSNDCGAERVIDFNFNITDYPVAGFTSASNCAGSAVQFTDSSDPAGSVITKWVWDFDDAANSTASNTNTSALPNPQHIFTQGGRTYNVKLTVTNENGCESAVLIQPVHISLNPTADFKFSAPGCAGSEVTFTDKSIANEGNIIQWIWNFNDGSSPVILTSNTPFTHVFNNAATYNVTLQVVTNMGCSNTKSQYVVVHATPQADFVLPDACLVDNAVFTNTSTIADGTESQFTYQWNFGDNTPVTTTRDGIHKYTAAGTYTVSLKVTSKDGCVFEKSKEFTLNGAFPVPVFTIADQVCSSDNMLIEDHSTVNPGKLTRYDVYYDYDRHPEQVEIYDRDHLTIPANKIFTHNYGMFSAPPYTDYHIKIIIYSGSDANCIAEYNKQVRVYANPVVTLTPPVNMCQEEPAVQIIPDIGIYTGRSEFSGAGITADGLFDPKKAGPGAHEIKYVFYNDGSNCTYQSAFTITVYPTPVISGKREFVIEAGGHVTLEPMTLSLNSSTLTYKWSPRQGLDRDYVMSPVASPASSTQYTLTVTSANGCVATALFNVNVLQTPVTYNTFTPNGDGINDTWVIPHIEDYPKATIEVFNRNGSRVFYSVGYPVPWDGRFKGVDLPAGTYYYVINPKNGEPSLSGPVTIIR